MEIRNDGQSHTQAINLEGSTTSELEVIASHPAVHADVREMARLYLQSRPARLAGRIQEALALEAKADRLYETLPAHLRW